MKTSIIFITCLFLSFGMAPFTPQTISNFEMMLMAQPVPAAAAPLPDLKVMSVTIKGSKVFVRIKNVGQAASIYCNLKVSFLQGDDADSGVAQSWNHPVPALAVNRDISLTVDIGNKSFPGKGCLVRVDTQNDVTESDETNNQFFTRAPQAFTVQADLAAVDLQINQSQVVGTVKNVGGVQYLGSRRARLIRIVRYGQHQKIDELTVETVPSLNPGQSFTLKVAKPTDFPGASKYTWILRIDNGDMNPGNDKTQKVWTKFDDN